MSQQTSRRTFLGQALLAGPSLAALPSLAAWAAPQPPRAWQTSSSGKMRPLTLPNWSTASDATPADTIELVPEQQFQDLLGFGAALTDATCYLLSQMKTDARQALLRDCFSTEGLGLSIARTTIGSSDYSRDAYTYDDTTEPDPQMAHFSLDHDRAYILPMLREAQQANSDLYVFSSPWSPPAWMKASHTLLGGSMRKASFAPYADYFVKFLEGYRAEHVNIRAITVQNEIDTDQDGRMPQAMWGQEYEIGFIRDHLGPAIEKSGLDTKIWILDHNYNLWGRVVDEFEDGDLAKYVDGVAWHGYYGDPSSMTRVHEMFPHKNAYWTEGGPDYTDADYETDWAKWSSKFTTILNNWSRCIVSWNLVLDEKGRPNIGPFSCGGVVTLNSQTQQITQSGMYWAFAHYGRHIRRGARVFATRGTVGDVDHVAAQNPDGSRVLVLTNNATTEKRVNCRLAAQALRLSLPASSVTTIVL